MYVISRSCESDCFLSPIQGLESFWAINPWRCPGLSSVGLTALADEIAHPAVPHDGITFGTNDLTQTAPGMSRDDSGSFLPVLLLLQFMSHRDTLRPCQLSFEKSP